MRRRSIRVRYVFFGAISLFFVLDFFTQILIPLERFTLTVANSFVFSNFQAIENLGKPQNILLNPAAIRVVAKRSDEFQDMFLINTSAPVGAKVLSGDVLVGIVVEQSIDVSKVQAVTSPFFKINGVLSRSGIPLELTGQGASLLEARVPRGSDVQKGDVIYHDEGDALSLGVVSRIIDVVSDPFLVLMVSSSVNLTTIQHVELLVR